MSRRDLCVWTVVSILCIPLFLSEAFADGEGVSPRVLPGWSEVLDLSTFRQVSMDVPENAPQLEADLEVEYAGLQRDKVVVRVMMLVSPQSLQASRQPGADGLEFSVAGQVLHGGQPYETFLYRLRGRSAGRSVPLVFERYLEPGDYVLRLRVEHLASGSVMVTHEQLSVPQMQTASAPRLPEVAPVTLKIGPAPAPLPQPAAPEAAQALAEADAALSARRPGLQLLPPSGALLVGNARFSVRVDQAPDLPAEEKIARVAFTLDGGTSRLSI